MTIRLFGPWALAEGERIDCDPVAANYLVRVMRLDVGDSLLVFNGRDGEWRAEVADVRKTRCVLAIGHQTRPQPDPGADAGPWLLFAPIKRTRIDTVAEKATELGAGVLWPVLTRHTAVGRVNTDRLRANAVEAAEQCRRLSVPEVRELVTLGAALEDWPAERRLLVCDETGAGRPLADVLTDLPPGPVAILVGPEGGFAKTELDLLGDLAFVTPVGLGPRILRAETAALAALACWQALRGDWGRSPTRDG